MIGASITIDAQESISHCFSEGRSSSSNYRQQETGSVECLQIQYMHTSCVCAHIVTLELKLPQTQEDGVMLGHCAVHSVSLGDCSRGQECP